MLHSARLRGVSGREARWRSSFLQQNDRHAAASQLDSKHKAARPAADNDDGTIELLSHRIPAYLFGLDVSRPDNVVHFLAASAMNLVNSVSVTVLGRAFKLKKPSRTFGSAMAKLIFHNQSLCVSASELMCLKLYSA
jgi:hypothetical protein